MENENKEMLEKEELIESICLNFDKIRTLEAEIGNLSKNEKDQKQEEQDLTAVLN